MVGSRFVEDLLAADTAGRFDITVARRRGRASPTTGCCSARSSPASTTCPPSRCPRPTSPRLDGAPGRARAVRLDREDRVVVTADGTPPPLRPAGARDRARAARDPARSRACGRTGGDLPAGVHALRTIDDAREIVAATLNATRAVVLGAGVLGLEAACGLARRGVAVTVVHPAAALMERQLDDGGQPGRRARRWPASASTTASGVGADGGRWSRTAGCSGAAPRRRRGRRRRPARARDRHRPQHRPGRRRRARRRPRHRRRRRPRQPRRPPGVRDRRLRPAARGRHRPRRPGLGAVPTPRRALLRRHAGAELPPASAWRRPSTAGSDVVRLKAHGLDVVTMGVCGSQRADDPAQRTLRLSDPDVGRHVEVVVSGGVARRRHLRRRGRGRRRPRHGVHPAHPGAGRPGIPPAAGPRRRTRPARRPRPGRPARRRHGLPLQRRDARPPSPRASTTGPTTVERGRRARPAPRPAAAAAPTTSAPSSTGSAARPPPHTTPHHRPPVRTA